MFRILSLCAAISSLGVNPGCKKSPAPNQPATTAASTSSDPAEDSPVDQTKASASGPTDASEGAPPPPTPNGGASPSTGPHLAAPPTRRDPVELCAEGEHRACRALGHSKGRQGKPKLDLLEKACAGGVHENACYDFVIYADRKKASELTRAAQVARDGCRFGSRRLCGLGRYSVASSLWDLKVRTSALIALSAALAAEACRAKDRGGCVLLSLIGGAHIDGLDMRNRRVRKDISLGRALIQKACVAKHPASCYQLARTLNEDAPRSPRLALHHFETVCKGRGHYAYLSCAAAGRMLRTGRDMAPNRKAARERLIRSCPLDWKSAAAPKGCLDLGQMLLAGEGGPKDPSGAKKALRLACQAGEKLGCGSAATR